MNPDLNQFLVFRPGVVRTPETDKVIAKLDPFFAMAGVRAYVESAKRTADDQLRIIRDYLTKKGLDKLHPDAFLPLPVNSALNKEDGEADYFWQPAWSHLLHAGVIINPPLPVVCLMDSKRPDGSNRKGVLIQPSPHFFGKCFDIGGGHKFVQIGGVLNKLSPAERKEIGIKNVIVERENNAFHVDVN